MSFFHAMYAPYKVGDRVKVVGPAAYEGKCGSVAHREPEDDAFDGEALAYWVTFDGESEMCEQAFGYWQLALEERPGAAGPGGAR